MTLDPSSSTAENLEALAPLIKSIQENDSEQLYLRSLDGFVEEKEREIEKICEGNYEVRSSKACLSGSTCVADPVGLCLKRPDAIDDKTRHGASAKTDRGDGWADGRRRQVTG